MVRINVDRERAWWCASGRYDEATKTFGDRFDVGNDAAERFARQYAELRRAYVESDNAGCPSMRHAFRLFTETGDAVAAWKEENGRWSLRPEDKGETE